MAEEQFKNELIKEYKLIEKWFEANLKEFISKEGITKPLYEHYETAIVFSDPVYIGSFKKDTPDFIKLLLNVGLELAKAKIDLKNH